METNQLVSYILGRWQHNKSRYWGKGASNGISNKVAATTDNADRKNIVGKL